MEPTRFVPAVRRFATDRRRRRSAGGFSLFELMIVLALFGLLAAVALPNLQNIYDSITLATQRDRLLDQFSALGREAVLRGRDQVVLGTVGESAQMEDEDAQELGDRYALNVPEGWDVQLDQPLIVRANGVCLGAEVVLLHGGGVDRRLLLRAPFCPVARS